MYLSKRIFILISFIFLVYFTGCQKNTNQPHQLFQPSTKLNDVKWKNSIAIGENDSVTGLVIEDRTIFASSRYGEIHAIDKKTGNTIWSYLTDIEKGSVHDFINCLSTTTDSIFVATTNGIYSLDKKSGKKNWKYSTLDMVTACPISTEDNIMYFGSWDGYFYAVDKTTGKLLWNKEIAHKKALASSPILVDNTFYMYGSDGILSQISKNYGDILWKFETELSKNDYNKNPIGGMLSSSLIFDKGILYFGSWDGNFYAIDVINKKEKWKFKAERIEMSPVISNTNIFFASETTLYALEKDSGKLKWKKEDIHAYSQLFDGKGILYFGDWKQHILIAVDENSGQEKWNLDTGDWVSYPKISDDVLFFGSYDGFVYAKELPR